jgi:flavodoxin
MRTLIAYYTWQGHTAKVAEALGKELIADIIKIEPTCECCIVINAIKAIFRMEGEINNQPTDLAAFDLIVVATPVWAHKVPPYVNTFLAQLTHTEGKSFAVLAEMGSSGGEKAISHVRRRLEAKGMRFAGSAITLEREVNSGAYSDKVTNLAETIRAHQ